MLKREEHETLIARIREVIGEEVSALISEDLTTLLSDYSSVVTDYADKEALIAKLTKEKEELIAVNGRLFLKVGAKPEDVKIEEVVEEIIEEITDEAIFDEKGEFIQ